jgi:flagellar protein FlaG
MPIDNLNQIGSNVVRPVKTDSTAQPAAAPRQELPGSGQSSPTPAPQAVEVKQAVSRLNEYAQSLRRDLQFSIDESSGSTVIKVIDSNSGETIRQIPSEVMLAIAQSLENAQGLFVNTTA